MARAVNLACLLLLAAAIGANAQSRNPTLFVLGDALSDNGNAYRASNGSIPAASQGYYQGRFSNGPVWNDFISNNSGIDIVNVAYPAATACRRTVDDNGGLPFVVPYLARQANSVATQSLGVSSNRAVFIWIGTNDLSNIASGLLNGQLNLTRALSFIPDLNACIKSAAEGLLKYGVTKSITIATVQNLAVQPVWPASAVSFGLAPSVIPTLLDNIGTMVRALNDGIRRDAADLAAHYLKARVSVFDMHGLYASTLGDATPLGFLNTTAACLEYDPFYNTPGDPSNRVIRTCPNPRDHMFWDYVNPSTALHSLIADRLSYHLATVSDLFLPIQLGPGYKA